MRAAAAASWSEGQTNVLLLRGGVEIQAGDATLRAADAVLWLEKLPGEARTRVEVVLLGTPEQEASIQTPEALRAGERLAADLVISGGVRFDAAERTAVDLSNSAVYQQALPLRPIPATGPATRAGAAPGAAETITIPGTTQPAERRVAPVQLSARELRTTIDGEGMLAVLATDGVLLTQRTAADDFIELTADRAVVFTTLRRLDEAGSLDPRSLQEAITGVYLEGDVRVRYTPGRRRRGERGFIATAQRLEAARAFYDFTTDRAMLSRAVLHTTEPEFGQPLTVRAGVVRQLALGRYEAHNAEVSTSRFAVPDYSLNASRVYVRAGERRTVFGGDHMSVRLFEVPFFYFPVVRGATIDNRLPLRRVSVGDSDNFGFGVETQWGLFETFGATPPERLDAAYSLGYLSERGPTAGLDVDYYGDIFRFGNRPELFDGELTGFLVNDHGEDDLGKRRAKIEQDDLRGRILWQHRHYLPAGFSAQARVGYASDPTFLEQWEREEFYEGLPHELFFNVERAGGNELVALAVEYEINDFATQANALQENASVERLPELRYGRFGQRLGPVTLTSRNRVGFLQFNNFGADLGEDLGFGDRGRTPDIDEGFPGIPAYGYTGAPEELVGRGDFRQELSAPMDVGPVSVVPFAVGRLTAYSRQADDESSIGRVLGGVGVRVGTAFSRTDDRVFSRILDIDRMRHVVEPSVTGFASWQNEERDDLLIFDQGIDDISDVEALQLSLRQRWQTKRGGPGRKRSVDVFAWTLEANLFDDEPEELVVPTSVGPATAADFRGTFYAGEPEASLARDTLNTDALWRVSDTTALVGDAAWSLESDDLATIAAGVVVTRGDRVSYSLGGRYVEPLDLTLAVGSISYQLSQRYHLAGSANYDVEEGAVRNTAVFVTRRFDRFFINVGVYLDRLEDDGGFRFTVAPVGFRNFSLNSSQFEQRR